jgi:hypothetical protein
MGEGARPVSSLARIFPVREVRTGSIFSVEDEAGILP